MCVLLYDRTEKEGGARISSHHMDSAQAKACMHYSDVSPQMFLRIMTVVTSALLAFSSSVLCEKLCGCKCRRIELVVQQIRFDINWLVHMASSQMEEALEWRKLSDNS